MLRVASCRIAAADLDDAPGSCVRSCDLQHDPEELSTLAEQSGMSAMPLFPSTADTTVQFVALPADLPAHEPFKISLALNGMEHVTSWITISDGEGRFLSTLELQLTALGGSISDVRWDAQYSEGEMPPERIILHTVWDEAFEHDFSTALSMLLLLSALLVCYLAYATCSRREGALAKLLFDDDDPTQAPVSSSSRSSSVRRCRIYGWVAAEATLTIIRMRCADAADADKCGAYEPRARQIRVIRILIKSRRLLHYS